MTPIEIQCFTLGQWMTNCYVVRESVSDQCWIIDAGFEPGPMVQFIEQQGWRPAAVVMTHAHVDHIAGLHEVRHAWPDLPIHIHPAEAEFLTDTFKNLSAALAEPVVAPEATDLIDVDKPLLLGEVAFELRHTPGHSPGGITLYQPQAQTAIVGDALFAGSIGRTDFPTSNHEQLIRAIHSQLFTLPDDTTVLSGHGPSTTIGREKRTNPFLR